MSVFPFLSYMSMLVPIVLVVGTKDCLQTNYGDVVKFNAVPSFMCLNFLLVHGRYLYSTLALNMHLPFFFDVVCTQVHCLPINYENNVFKTLSEYCCRCH